MKKKNLLALGTALVLSLSLVTPALAATGDVTADTTTGKYVGATEVTGSVKTPTVTVNVPTTNTVIVNPYAMEVTNSEGAKITSQIISAPQYIKNLSDVAISVDATTTGVIPEGSKAVFGTAEPTEKTTTKTVFMYMEIGHATSDDGQGDPTWADKYDKTLAVADAAKTGMLLVSNKATTKAGIIVLEATDTSDANYAAYRLGGSVAAAPSTPWATGDKVNVTLAFTFNPAVVATTTP